MSLHSAQVHLCCDRLLFFLQDDHWKNLGARRLYGAWACTMFFHWPYLIICCQGPSCGVVRTKPRFQSASSYLKPYEEPYQNGCLSVADLKWVYDGDIRSHVCENTITSMSRLNHSPLCDDSLSPPPQSPHPQSWSPVHAVEVYYSQRRETHRAIMDGPRVKTAPIAYQLPISIFLAECQTPRQSQANEITWKCRYSSTFVLRTNLHLINSVAHPSHLSAGEWEKSFENICLFVFLKEREVVNVHMKQCAHHEEIRWFPRLICSVETQLLACLSVRPFDCWPHILCHLSTNPVG